MMTTKQDTKTSSLIINKLTKEQYNKALEEGQINEDELYLVAGEDYTREEVDSRLNRKQDKLIAGSNIIIDEVTNTISSIGGDTSSCVHIEGHEIINGVKEFTGGSGGSTSDVSLKTLNAIAIGDETQTNYTGIYNHRKCSNDSGIVNTAGFLVNSDGSAKFTHKRGTATSVGTGDDSYILFNSNKLVYSNGTDSTSEKAILHEGNVKTINGESIKGTGNIVIKPGASSFADITGNPTDNTNLKNALDGKQPTGDYATNTRVNEVEGKIPSLTGYATETYVNNHHDSTKQDVITNLSTIEANATAGKSASDTIATYGNIVTHNASEFQVSGDYATNTALTEGLNTKQNKLTPGTNITIDPETNTISANAITSVSWGDISGNISSQLDLSETLDDKQDVITDLSDIRDNASNAKSTIDAHIADISIHVSTSDRASWNGKQEVIEDLEIIRTNAQAGADIVPQVNSNTQRIEDLIVSKFPNATPIGQPTVQDGYVSGFSATTYMQFPFEDISRGLPFDIYFSFTTSNDVTTQQNIIDSYFGIAVAISNSKGLMAISTNGTNWESGSIIGSNTISPNTTYYAKVSWTGSEYSTALSTDDKTYVPDMYYSNSNSPHKTSIYIGGSPNIFGPNSAHPFKGTINFRGAKIYLPTLNLTVWEGMADVAVASRANVSLSNLDEAGEAKFTKGNSAYDTIQDYGDIVTHNAIEFALKSEIPSISDLAKDSDVVHKANAESISGVKTFTGGSGGNNVAIKAPNGVAIGGTTQTAYSQYATIRLVNDKVNTGSYYIDGNGSVLFRHKTGTATAEGTANDAMFTINPVTGIKAGYSGTAGKGIADADLHDVLIDTLTYSKLNTTAKDVLGAINELKTRLDGILDGDEVSY